MSRKRQALLSIAVASKKMGCVFLIGGVLKDWKRSAAASESAGAARSKLRVWIATFEPDIVVLENPGTPKFKGPKTKKILRALAQVARDEPVRHVEVIRTKNYQNKYEEAKALGKQYPQIAAWVPPKRKFWKSEPANTIYFEALALAQPVLNAD